ncbi:MAG: DHH family phosphoesterase [Nanoarchaeota archaeon]
MITKKQINEVRKYLKDTQNPLFFFDNDADGLCSFLLIKRYLNNGKGVAVKGTPELNENFFFRVNEFNPDYIFILDVPEVSDDFIEKAKSRNIPIIWIDHHKIEKKIPKYVKYYNSCKKEFGEPVAHICYEITQKKEDLWIALTGCISDNYIPDYYEELNKDYQELYVKEKNALKIYYKSEIGKIGRILNSSLKDRTTNVMKMIRFMSKAKSPYDVLNEINKNKSMHDKFNEINEKRKTLMNKFRAEIDKSKKILFFQYQGQTSMSSELANELKIDHPEKTIIVAYISDSKVNISARGDNVRELMKKITKNLNNATTGGHEKAVGARIQLSDLEKLKKNIKEIEKEL